MARLRRRLLPPWRGFVVAFFHRFVRFLAAERIGELLIFGEVVLPVLLEIVVEVVVEVVVLEVLKRIFRRLAAEVAAAHGGEFGQCDIAQGKSLDIRRCACADHASPRVLIDRPALTLTFPASVAEGKLWTTIAIIVKSRRLGKWGRRCAAALLAGFSRPFFAIGVD
jgi:hypothetical protein